MKNPLTLMNGYVAATPVTINERVFCPPAFVGAYTASADHLLHFGLIQGLKPLNLPHLDVIVTVNVCVFRSIKVITHAQSWVQGIMGYVVNRTKTLARGHSVRVGVRDFVHIWHKFTHFHPISVCRNWKYPLMLRCTQASWFLTTSN